jgi:hypothetical protein
MEAQEQAKREPELRVEWAEAYITQARSDWNLFELLRGTSEVAACHHLHYLQMACEKLAKAYRFRDTSTPPSSLLTQHVGFAKFINSFLLSPRMRERFDGKHEQLRVIQKECNRIAREVEQLAPAVDRGNSPQNAEYPWRHEDRIITPCHYDYPKLSLLRERGGRAFLKWVRLALESFGDIQIQ